MASDRRTPPTTLSELLSSVAERHGERPALIERDGRTLTFAELSGASAALARELRVRRVSRGDVVGVWLPNWVEMVVWEFALAALGAAMLGINTRYGVIELTHLLRRGRPVGVVAPARFLELDFAGRLRRASDAASGVAAAAPWVAVARPSGSDDLARFDVGGGTWTPTSVRESSTSREQIPTDGRPSDPVNYFTSSGSTGLPKLAGHDQRSVAVHSANVVAALDMSAEDRFLAVLPLTGVFGFNPTMAMLSAGGAWVLEPVFDPRLVLSDVAAHGITHVVGGDDMLGRLMDVWRAADADRRRTLRCLRRGGIADFAGRAGAVIEWAEDELAVRLSGVYGSSELFALTSIWPAVLDRAERRRGGGSVVSAEIEVRAIDPASGDTSPAGSTGELQFRGYNVVTGYLGDDDAARAAFTDDGWFRSGDLGFVLEEQGSFVYICRDGDALRLRGFLVEPAEIEQFLCSHRDVAAAKVVGARSAAGGDVAVAYVRLIAGAAVTSDELTAFCREQLAPFKVPAYVNVTDDFPVTTGTNGTKIRTAELRRRAEAQLAAQRAR
jgi:acyl-CoA synthetase (AMP-forming)/AMP-acid ligase II